MDTQASISDLEKRLWGAADEFRANSRLKAAEYSVPVLGLIFLKYADHRFAAAQQEIEGKGSGRRTPGKTDYQARGVMYLPDAARYSKLINLPDSEDLGKAINDAMKAIEAENDELRDVLPKTYNRLENRILQSLLKNFNAIPMDVEGDVFGRIYEYFLGNFAMAEGQKGGEFFTPTSLVKLIVEIIEPFSGLIFDPACGSGGMFVQSARFAAGHRASAQDVVSIYGEERVAENVRLCRMNLAVHGLAGDIRQGNSYYEDLHRSRGKFDYLMANPPFNVDKVEKDRLKDDPRFPFGMPRVDNANYLWIQLFYSSLNEHGRAGFVMANSAGDARGSELEIRQKMIRDKAVDVMVAIGSNFFYTVTLPCTLWFLDKAKRGLPPYPPSPPAPLPKGEGSEQASLSPDLLPEGAGSSEAKRAPGAVCGGPSVPAAIDGSKEVGNYRGGQDFSMHVKRTRELRREHTPAEEVFWELTRNRRFLDLKFRRQHQIGSYIVDFYCHEHRLIVEFDGSAHDVSAQQKHDHKRDAYLTSMGNSVLRFKNKELLDSPEYVLKRIAEMPPSPSGESPGKTAQPTSGTCFGSELPSPSGRGAGGEGLAVSNPRQQKGRRYSDTVLFIDARHIYRQLDRAHRDFTPAQQEFLANIVRLYRGEKPENVHGSLDGPVQLVDGKEDSAREFGELFADGYEDVPGLCKVATLAEIEEQGFSLNPGRYVGVADREEDDFDFYERLEALNEELEVLNSEAHEIEDKIARNVVSLMDARRTGS